MYILPALNSTSALRHAYSVASTRSALYREMISLMLRSCVRMDVALSGDWLSGDGMYVAISVASRKRKVTQSAGS